MFICLINICVRNFMCYLLPSSRQLSYGNISIPVLKMSMLKLSNLLKIIQLQTVEPGLKPSLSLKLRLIPRHHLLCRPELCSCDMTTWLPLRRRLRMRKLSYGTPGGWCHDVQGFLMTAVVKMIGEHFEHRPRFLSEQQNVAFFLKEHSELGCLKWCFGMSLYTSFCLPCLWLPTLSSQSVVF